MSDDRVPRSPAWVAVATTVVVGVLVVGVLVVRSVVLSPAPPAADDPAAPATGTTGPTSPLDEPTATMPAGQTTVPAPPTDEAAQPTTPAVPTGPVELVSELIATGLRAPWDLVLTPDGRIFVTERDTGVLVEVSEGGTTREVQRFPVNNEGEGGLLGLAASPNYDQDGLLYAYYTAAGDNRVVRFRPGETPEDVLVGVPRARFHNGGRIAFGPDGMLYVGTGDALTPDLAQDRGSLAGKILRLAPDGTVPVDNPTPGSPVWSLGHRNVQGLAWNARGELFASEFGPDRDDEINRIVPGGNYGWPLVTGAAGREQFHDPILVAQPPEASWSGVALLSGGAIPQWEGDLFAAGLRGQRLWRVSFDAEEQIDEVEQLFVGAFGRLRHVVQAPDGSLWLLTGNRDGRGSPTGEDDRVVRVGPG